MERRFTLLAKWTILVALLFVCSVMNAQIIKQISQSSKNILDDNSSKQSSTKISPVFIDVKPVLYKDDQKVKYAEFDSICNAPSFISFETEESKGYYQGSDEISVMNKYLSVRENIDRLEMINSTVDYYGITYNRYQQYYYNIKIDGAQYISTVKENKIHSITGKYVS